MLLQCSGGLFMNKKLIVSTVIVIILVGIFLLTFNNLKLYVNYQTVKKQFDADIVPTYNVMEMEYKQQDGSKLFDGHVRYFIDNNNYVINYEGDRVHSYKNEEEEFIDILLIDNEFDDIPLKHFSENVHYDIALIKGMFMDNNIHNPVDLLIYALENSRKVNLFSSKKELIEQTIIYYVHNAYMPLDDSEVYLLEGDLKGVWFKTNSSNSVLFSFENKKYVVSFMGDFSDDKVIEFLSSLEIE